MLPAPTGGVAARPPNWVVNPCEATTNLCEGVYRRVTSMPLGSGRTYG
jgi:hypothetical protein